jgi:hypothetical protein
MEYMEASQSPKIIRKRQGEFKGWTDLVFLGIKYRYGKSLRYALADYWKVSVT